MQGPGYNERGALLTRPSYPSLKASSGQQDWLLPLAVCSLGWLIYLSLAPWRYGLSGGEQHGSPFQSLFAAAANSATFLTNLLLLVPAACFGQGALQRLLPSVPPWLHALLLWAGLTLTSVAIAYAQRLLPPQVAPPVNLLAQQAGIALGILLWWSAGRPLAAVLHQSRWRPFWHYAALLGVLPILLFPLNPADPLTELAIHWPPSSLEVYLQDLQRHLSYLFKVSMLWVPVGLVYTLGGYRQALQVWMLAVVLTFGLLGLPLFSGLKVEDVLEVACALLGTEAGAWIGTRTHWRAAFTARAAARAAVPQPQPAAAFQGTILQDLIQVPPAQPSPASVAAASYPQALTILRRVLALGLLLGVALSLWDFPRLGFGLSLGLAGYVLLLWRFPYAWLLIMPAVLPVLDFAPWTGRFFFDEFDRVMLVTLAMAFWHGSRRQSGPVLGQALALTLTLFAGACLISLLLGLLPWQALDANAFSNAWSHYNSLRVGKGFLWSLLVLTLLRWGRLPEPGTAQRLFTTGLGIGVLGVVLVGLQERWQFAHGFDFSTPDRNIASMHTGGYSEACLVSAIPFLWLWLNRHRNPWLLAAGAVLLLLAIYVTLTTVSPGSVPALIVALGVLVTGNLRRFLLAGKRRLDLAALSGLLVLGVGTLITIILQGTFFQGWLAPVDKEWQTHFNHWSNAVAMMDQGWTTRLFGMGLGRFPEIYLYRNLEGIVPTTYRFEQEDHNTFLRLGSGEPLYLVQRVPVTPQHRYTLYIDLRSRQKNARLETTVCEKQLLDSPQCHWVGVDFPAGDNRWHPREVAFNSEAMGTGNILTRRPVEIALYNPVQGTIIDVDNVRLVDDQGHELLANGNFSQGGDYWFSKTQNLLPWRLDNLWVQVLFEQGWLGLLTFMLLLGILLNRLVSALWRGDTWATALLASATAFLTLGLFDSEFDAPRLTVLFFSVLFVGVLTTAPPSYPKQAYPVGRPSGNSTSPQQKISSARL
jgi:hypothetical protein